MKGVIFLILAVTGIRMKIAKMLPENIKYATTCGIGLFLAHIGLQSAEGIGLVSMDAVTKV